MSLSTADLCCACKVRREPQVNKSPLGLMLVGKSQIALVSSSWSKQSAPGSAVVRFFCRSQGWRYPHQLCTDVEISPQGESVAESCPMDSACARWSGSRMWLCQGQALDPTCGAAQSLFWTYGQVRIMWPFPIPWPEQHNSLRALQGQDPAFLI